LNTLQKKQNHSSKMKDHGQRYVFNGTSSDPMFEMEPKVDLPVLKDGEVLVKVKAATICMSDIHTVCGMRVEPTPRFVNNLRPFNI
jgi:NADPH:quinone reductase-like Zn-dependent oxidoreductase